MKSDSALLAIGLFAALLGSAEAQTKSNDQPTAIGTSQETADKAHKEAMNKGGTATVVRTGPSAADKASEMTSDAKDGIKDSTGSLKAKVKAKTGNDTTKQ